MMNQWLTDWFSQVGARMGGVTQRSVGDVLSYGISIENVVDEACQRDWHVIQTGGHLVILHHDGVLQILA